MSTSTEIEFLDKLPTLIRTGNPRKQPPEIVNFLAALKANPGKWAKWPVPRKTKPQVEEGYDVASRGGSFYAIYLGPGATAVDES